MRILILGAGGMLGHKLVQQTVGDFEVFASFRSATDYQHLPLFRGAHVIDGTDAKNMDSVTEALTVSRPAAVVNCIGIVKQRAEAHDPIRSITINSLFPHRLLALCRASGARLIHISTDCVFSGRKGMYTESDLSDADDLYGRTKFLGEVTGPGALTLRTSIIGRELHSRLGLVEWFLSSRAGSVRGFTNAIYSGVTTKVLARLIAGIILESPDLAGVYHVASEPIRKYDLLVAIKEAFQLPVGITPDPSVIIDRSLNGEAFARQTGFKAPSWPQMIREMAEDPTPYEEWRPLRAS